MSILVEKLRMTDSLFDPESDENIVYYRYVRGSDVPLYKVFIYLDGLALPFVNKVTYILHPTFPDPERTVSRTINNPKCQLVIWAWGVFTVRALVEDKQGQTIHLEHYLTFDKQISEAKNERSSARFVDMG